MKIISNVQITLIVKHIIQQAINPSLHRKEDRLFLDFPYYE